MRLAVAWIAVTACSANDDFPAPQIASLSPDHAIPGAMILISGNYFCHQSEEDPQMEPCTMMGAVYFGSTIADALQYEENAITVEVPPGMGMADISVAVAGERSNSVTFTFD
jgi:hypothetical protein